MKIILIGHPCIDIIHRENSIENAPGGIIYSLSGFFLNNNCNINIIPIFNIDLENVKTFSDFISKLNFNTDFLQIKEKSINKVHLFFEGNNLQFECYSQKAEKIDISLIPIELISENNFLINMISGFEIELNDLIELRKKTKGKIYLDFHTLTRGMDENGKRAYRPVPQLSQWLKCADLIQMNDLERISLFTENISEEQFAEYAFSNGVSIVIITKSEEGAVCYANKNNVSEKYLYKYPNKINVKNVVGCGDIFGATFFSNYCIGFDAKECLEKAVTLATERTAYDNLDNLINSKKNLL